MWLAAEACRLAAVTKRVLSVLTTITNSDCFSSAIGCRGLCQSQTEGPHKKRKKGCFFTAPLYFIQPDNRFETIFTAALHANLKEDDASSFCFHEICT